jgi:hypothetical protein
MKMKLDLEKEYIPLVLFKISELYWEHNLLSSFIACQLSQKSKTCIQAKTVPSKLVNCNSGLIPNTKLGLGRIGNCECYAHMYIDNKCECV